MNTQEQDFPHITFHNNCKKETKVVTNEVHTSCQSEDSLLKKQQKKQSVKHCVHRYIKHLSLQNTV